MPGRHDFQSWYDLCAFEEDDVITYNQGLLTVALKAARGWGADDRGLKPLRRPIGHVQRRADYPLSEQKPCVCVDAGGGTCWLQWLFGEPLLSDTVRRHFEMIMRASRTPYGFKVTAQISGEYLPPTAYSTRIYRSRIEDSPVGSVLWRLVVFV